MWMTYKITKQGETFDSILKKLKIKDPNLVLKNSENKKISAQLKDKKKPLKMGLQLQVPDPKAKLYIVKGPKGSMVFTKKEYFKYITGLDSQLTKLWMRYQHEFDAIAEGHDVQSKIVKESWIVKITLSQVSGLFDPTPSRKKAEAACKILGSAVSSGKYRKVMTLAPNCEKAVNTYQRDVILWRNALTGGAEKVLPVLIWTKRIGAICGAVAIVTITAPVTVTGALLVNGLAVSGMGLANDYGDEIGRTLVGVEKRSAGDVMERTILNFVTGVLGAGVAGVTTKALGPIFSKMVLSKSVLRTQAYRLLKFVRGDQYIMNMINAYDKELIKVGFNGFTKYSMSHIDTLVVNSLVQFFVRLGMPSIMKALMEDTGVENEIRKWLQRIGKKAGSMSSESLSTEGAKHLVKTKADGVFDHLYKANRREFEKSLQKEIQKLKDQFVKSKSRV